MNKYVIPAILGVVVLVAAAFAFAPVEKAATVHTSINTVLGDIICDGYYTFDNDNLEFNPSTNDCIVVET